MTETFDYGIRLQASAPMPADPLTVRQVINDRQTWVGVARSLAGDLTGLVRQGGSRSIDHEAHVVVPTQTLPADDQRVLGPEFDTRLRWGWEPESDSRQTGHLDATVTVGNGTKVGFEGRIQISGEPTGTLEVEGVLSHSRIPTRLRALTEKSALAVLEGSLGVVGDHVRARLESPDVAGATHLTSAFWEAAHKPRWIRSHQEQLTTAVRGLARSIEIRTPRGVPSGAPEGYRQVVGACLAAVLEVERACRFAERTRSGQDDRSRTAHTVAQRCRDAADRISLSAQRPPSPPLIRNGSVHVAGLAPGHPEVPFLFALMLAPSESYRSAWRVSITDWWRDQGYAMITDRRLIIVHDDSFNDLGKIDRTIDLSSVSDPSVTDMAGKMGGPNISMGMPKGRLTIEFSAHCSVDDADAICRQLGGGA